MINFYTFKKTEPIYEEIIYSPSCKIQFKVDHDSIYASLLKQEFVKPSKSNVASIQTDETYLGFKIITDSIKVIKDKGHTMYIFPVVLSSKRAVSFQNLTIDESTAGTIAFVNTYTPTKKWIADYKKGHPGKFEGNINVKYLNLNNGVTSTNLPTSNKKSNQNVIAVAQTCINTSYYFELPYTCGSGEHYPGDNNCTLTGDLSAGYMLFEAIVTECFDVPDPIGGGGGTTPTPPPGYEPCPQGPTEPPLVSSKKPRGNKIMILPPTECDSLEQGSPFINQFILDFLSQKKYPKFTNLIKELKNNVQNDKKILDALKDWSGLTESKILEKLAFGEGPTIVVKDLTGRYGYFDRNENPNVINIDASWVRGLEAANLLSTRQATAFLLGVTVLHEFVHQARAANNLDRNYEYGNAFEKSAFGLVIHGENAGNYSYIFYGKSN
ncbi:hypothetical protein [Pedobacter insulae]|uniref:Metallopeptidase toxin 3 n=1 Tax=Pedobacter insulae TaxID=414048 RepID=A0A1I2TED5_9SPHI|nr:hypothetical protein [Pedobacter insulae]SFG60976.1 Metallopeptidase toxin 3 [Pedobacter insulae]